MSWILESLDILARQPVCGYAPGQSPASEPTALAALALVAHGRAADALPATEFLASIQGEDGSVGVRQGEDRPGWPTSLAILAWKAANPDGRYDVRILHAAKWILSVQGTPLARTEEFGHDTELVAWSWAENTHSWIEPTALHVTALRAVGKRDHPRVRDGVAMLLDRQLPGGGCNYGNTVVLGQMLRPHVQPTGVALLALASEARKCGRITKSASWLRRSIGPETTASSLAWALLGLRAHDIELPQADEWLAALSRTHQQNSYKLALLALAAKGLPQ